MGKDIKRDKTPVQKPKTVVSLMSQELLECYDLYKELINKRPILSTAEIKERLRQKVAEVLCLQVGDSVVKNITEDLIIQFKEDEFLDIRNQENIEEENTERFIIGEKDYEVFKKLTEQDPEISNQCKRVLLALIYYYRKNYHSSGWVKYDKKFIFHLASLDDNLAKEKEHITQYLHSFYGLDMRVVGSNTPIPCYKIDWLFDLGAVGFGDNKELDLGFLSKEKIKELSE